MLTSNPGVSSILGSATGQGLPLVTYKIPLFFFSPMKNELDEWFKTQSSFLKFFSPQTLFFKY